MTGVAEKVRENKLRRKAVRQGYRLEKSRRRDPHATDFGLYALISNRTNFPVNPENKWMNSIHSWTLDRVEAHLNGRRK